MRLTSPRRRIALAAAAGAAALLFTGCASGQAGAAAIVGGERIGNDEIETEMAAIAELAEESGQEIPEDVRAGIATGLLHSRVLTVVLDQLAEAEGVTVTDADTAERLAAVGGPEALAAQGLFGSQIDDQARRLAVADALIEGTGADELAPLEEDVREELRAQLLDEGRALGLDEDTLERDAEEELANQGELVRGEAANRYLNERIQSYVVGTDVQVSPRYGVIDPTTLAITPGASPLSAPGALPQPPAGQ